MRVEIGTADVKRVTDPNTSPSDAVGAGLSLKKPSLPLKLPGNPRCSRAGDGKENGVIR